MRQGRRAVSPGLIKGSCLLLLASERDRMWVQKRRSGSAHFVLQGWASRAAYTSAHMRGSTDSQAPACQPSGQLDPWASVDPVLFSCAVRMRHAELSSHAPSPAEKNPDIREADLKPSTRANLPLPPLSAATFPEVARRLLLLLATAGIRQARDDDGSAGALRLRPPGSCSPCALSLLLSRLLSFLPFAFLRTAARSRGPRCCCAVASHSCRGGTLQLLLSGGGGAGAGEGGSSPRRSQEHHSQERRS